jgi:O-succinylbenzoate synthase
VEHLRQAGAVSGVSIKPSRLGGLLPARDLHDGCVEMGLPATAGGMLETGLGRHALAALASLPGFTLTGDLSPAGRWLAADPWPDLEMGAGQIRVPTTPGVAPSPDPELIDRYTAKRSELTI